MTTRLRPTTPTIHSPACHRHRRLTSLLVGGGIIASLLWGCAGHLRQPGTPTAMQDLLTHLERIGFFEAAHHRQTGEYTADIENGLRVKGLMRGAVVLTTDDQFVALAWYESGNGPVCRLVTAKAPTVTATCLDAEGRVIFETTQEGGRPPLP